MESDLNVFGAYKPFRNKLRKTSLEDSLYTIWAYSQNMQLELDIPADIEVHPRYNTGNYGERGLYPWDLEVLAREAIINAEYCTYSERRHDSLRKVKFFTTIQNQLRAIDGTITHEYFSPKNIMLEFPRLLHRQMFWQKMHLAGHLIRHYKIFGTEALSSIVLEVTGLTTHELLLIGMLMYFKYMKNPAGKPPFDFGVPEFSKDKFDIFLKRYATDLSNVKTLIEKEQNYNDQFFYSGVALKYYPLVEMQYRGTNCIVCPLPTLLFARITSGLYYDIYKHKNFGLHFGKAFENYVGDVLTRALSRSKITAIKEAKYYIGKDEKSTTDWIVNDADAAVFTECKTKRMQNVSKTRISDLNAISSDIKILADAIVQLYKSIADYQKGLYPNLPFVAERLIYPIIVTVEDWYIFDSDYQAMLHVAVLLGLQKNALPDELLTAMPYSYCSIADFEGMIQVTAQVGIKNFFEPKVRDQMKNGYVFNTYYGEIFPNETKHINSNLFEDEYNALFEFPEQTSSS